MKAYTEKSPRSVTQKHSTMSSDQQKPRSVTDN
uniref:Uncharacterized protein n=1 Tax=Anguilla anguilla TaxID=7936 RepID=A0A0E9QXE5_ANGAN